MAGRQVAWSTGPEFLDEVRLKCTRDPERGCLLWDGVVKDRYPEVMIGRRRTTVARRTLIITTGEVGEVARHSCDRPSCCAPEHLSWGTYADNSRDMVERGRSLQGDRNPSRQDASRLARGESHGLHRLTATEVIAIRMAAQQGASNYSQAQAYGVTKRTIQQVVRRATWKHV